MKGFELVFITDPSLSDKELESLLKNIKMSLKKSDGKLMHKYVWGRRRLAYEIAGNDFGVYHAWYFTGNGETVDELQRQFGYLDNVLRHQIVKADDLDAEAAFMQSLIPPKEENEVKEEVQQVTEESADAGKDESVNTENEKSEKAEETPKAEIEAEVSKDIPESIVKEEKTETIES
ncbi:MAG: 30S ribosomal protein S6 [Deltaproteobacteria bacterium]|jgi:small subunit ribosomal protein S6|nr:30S ribosomal protein S6 [Deltaproteobacteria bacterium]